MQISWYCIYTTLISIIGKYTDDEMTISVSHFLLFYFSPAKMHMLDVECYWFVISFFSLYSIELTLNIFLQC